MSHCHFPQLLESCYKELWLFLESDLISDPLEISFDLSRRTSKHSSVSEEGIEQNVSRLEGQFKFICDCWLQSYRHSLHELLYSCLFQQLVVQFSNQYNCGSFKFQCFLSLEVFSFRDFFPLSLSFQLQFSRPFSLRALFYMSQSFFTSSDFLIHCWFRLLLSIFVSKYVSYFVVNQSFLVCVHLKFLFQSFQLFCRCLALPLTFHNFLTHSIHCLYFRICCSQQF